MGSKDETTEASLVPGFVHEAGHALVAELLGIPCDGVYYQPDCEMFCAQFTGAHSPTSSEECLLSAGGVAAERVFFPDRDSEGGGKDREEFTASSPLTFDEALIQAHSILLNKKAVLEEIVSAMMRRVRSVNYNTKRLPGERQGATQTLRRIVLSRDKLREIIQMQ